MKYVLLYYSWSKENTCCCTTLEVRKGAPISLLLKKDTPVFIALEARKMWYITLEVRISIRYTTLEVRIFSAHFPYF